MRKEPKAMMIVSSSELHSFRDNFQILGMGNQSSTMGYHKPPGDLTTTIIKIITITLTPGLVTPAHHPPAQARRRPRRHSDSVTDKYDHDDGHVDVEVKNQILIKIVLYRKVQ